MKILLIKPPVIDFYQTSIRTQPLGLAYIASSLFGRGYEVEILDCQTNKKRSIPIPRELTYLSEYYPVHDISPFKLYGGYYHFGMSWEEITGVINNSDADIFGISSSFTPYHGEALKIAGLIKGRDADKIVIMGGSHVSCDPEGSMNDPRIDYIIIGEGEVRFPLLVEKIANNKINEIMKIDGIGYRENGRVKINPVRTYVEYPDDLPLPARDLLDPARYMINKKRSTMMMTSRGCPHKCAYCSAHSIMGDKFRTRSPESVVAEMKECYDRFGIKNFDFEDDNFTFDKKRAKAMLNLIIKTFGENTLGLSAMNGISFASLDKELLALMKEAGFDAINLSFVSSDVGTKEKMNRPEPPVKFQEIVNEAVSFGLSVVAYGIFGMPGQTTREMTETLVALAGMPVLIGPSVYYPTPGTPLFERCEREGLLPKHMSAWRSSAFPVETRDFSRLDLITFLRLTRALNYIKAKINSGELPDGSSLAYIIREIKNDITGEITNLNSNAILLTGTDRDDIWKYLLLKLFEERTFYRVKKSKGKFFEARKLKTSRTVLDYYLEKAWDMPVRKSRG